MSDKKRIVVLGASNNPDRYANIAIKLLLEKNYEVIPVNPYYDKIEGIKVIKDLNSINSNIDTLTIYINPEHLKKEITKIIKINPSRVIFNPGTESELLANELKKHNISYIEACTLILLKTNQF